MALPVAHKPPIPPLSINVSEVKGSLVRYPDSQQNIPGPFLLDGTATVMQPFLHGRLDVCAL
jgi:hypothetical protein